MRYENPAIESSYRQNDLGQTLYDLVLDLKPKKIIEFGTLNGYSAIAMAMALDKLGRGTIDCYDLWNKYPHKNSTMQNAMENVSSYGLLKYVNFHYGDFWEWKVEDADLIHIDLSNDGDIIERAVKKLKGFKGRIVFEGGTKERDEVEWMKKYNKKPILQADVTYEVLNPDFPSISII